MTLSAFKLAAERRSAHSTTVEAGVIARHNSAVICALFFGVQVAVLDIALGNAFLAFRR